MRELRKAMKETNAIWSYLLVLIGSGVCAWCSIEVLTCISNAVENYKNPMPWINKILAIYLLQIIFTSLVGLGYRLSCGLATTIWSDVAYHVLHADYAYFTKVSPSEIQSVAQKAPQVARIPQTVIRMINNFVRFLIAFVAIIRVNKNTAIPMVLIVSIAAVILYYWFKKWGEYDEEADKYLDERNKHLYQITSGFQEARSFKGAIKYHSDKLHSSDTAMLCTIKKRRIADDAIDLTWTVSDAIIKFALLSYGILGLNSGTIHLSTTVMTLILYADNVAQPIFNMVGVMDEVSPLLVAAKKVDELLLVKPELIDGKNELDEFTSDISFNDVSFNYEGSTGGLKNINLTIHKGEKIGICGKSGCGKSTLISLIPRFYDVDSGSIKLDGIDIRNLRRDAILKHVGMVGQSPYIFDGTIEENISYGRPGEIIPHDEIVEAAKKAAIYDFIVSRPDGFDTVVGERGLKLSGGQQQRIALARIFLANPEILLLDEATSALDNESESIIQETLEAFKDRTIIAVAHRLSTIKDYDRIVVMDDCKIVDIGTHDELIESSETYRRLQK